jgi:hypothetical protein
MGDPEWFGHPAFFGLGEAPETASRWRQGSAVLDEWNHNKFIVIGEVLPGNAPVLGCTGVIAEQSGSKIGVQYLKGGDKQAMLAIPTDVASYVNEMAMKVQQTGQAVKFERGGIAWEIKPTGWTEVNGTHGYLHMPGPGTVQTVHLGDSEIASKRKPHGSN